MTRSPDLAFLSGSALDVAPRLLGAVIRHAGVAVRVTEVEAYDGANDPASHAYRGQTPRNSVMFGPSGHLYVYFTYGMHHCCNVVCGQEGSATAVLLRAGEVVEGIELARERRIGIRDQDLARGPACLCRTLSIDRNQNGAALNAGVVRLTRPTHQPLVGPAVRTGPRVGVRQGAELPWRFWIDGEETVSAYRPAAPRHATKGA